MWCPSELVDRLEPHASFLLPVHCRTPLTSLYGREEVYPGWYGWVGTGRVTIPGTTQPPDLRLIYGILRSIRFIRPFDWILMYYY